MGQAKYPKMKENFDILNTNLDLQSPFPEEVDAAMS